jgi:hypothetical protein
LTALRDSTMRACDWPGCTMAFDIAVFWGTDIKAALAQPGQPWTQHPSFGLHMCAAHRGIWDRNSDGAHIPAVRPASCSCGHPLPGGTLGDMIGAYRAHLAVIAAM